jgi:DNA-directed RNA polymerase subunit alpha
MESEIDTCPLGHTFAKLPDHPTKDGKPRCPHCMSIAIEKNTRELHLPPDEILDRNINTLGLSTRVLNSLNESFVPQEWKDRSPDYYEVNLCHTIRDLVSKSENDLLHQFRFGKKSLNNVKECLGKLGLSLGMKLPAPKSHKHK